MAAHALSLLPISTPSRNHSCSKQHSFLNLHSIIITNYYLPTSFIGSKLPVVYYTNSPQYTHTRHSSTVATISVSLPTGYYINSLLLYLYVLCEFLDSFCLLFFFFFLFFVYPIFAGNPKEFRGKSLPSNFLILLCFFIKFVE